MLSRSVAALAIAVTLLAAPCAFGWGGPHRIITEAAMTTLPDWQREMLGDELEPLANFTALFPTWFTAGRTLLPTR